MAIITRMVSQDIISGFKGVLDYYVHDGIPCVRTWPRSPGKKRSPEVMSTWPAFTYAVKLYPTLSPFVREAYSKLPGSVGLIPRDWFMRAYLSGIFQYPH